MEKGALRVEARLQESERKEALVHIATRLLDPEGNLCAEADIVYFTYPEKVARRKLYFPGKEAFLEPTPGA
jgi:hypothetical protein